VRGFFAPGIEGVLLIGIVESFPVNILRVRREMIADRRRKVFVGFVRHVEVFLLVLHSECLPGRKFDAGQSKAGKK